MMLMTRIRSLTFGSPGRRQQIPRTMRSISTPACDARIQRVDHLRIDERVHLADDARAAPRARVLLSRSISSRNRSFMFAGATSSLR
jgi:hypothetical protein